MFIFFIFILHSVPESTTKKLFNTLFVKYCSLKTLLDGFARRYLVIDGFEGFLGKAHFRIRKVKRGKVYYNPCTSLPKRLRSVSAFNDALMSKELIVVVDDIPDYNYDLDEFGNVVGFSVTYQGSKRNFEF